MTFLWETADQPEAPAVARLRLWSRRGLLRVVLGASGWLLLFPVWWLGRTPALGGPYLGLAVFMAAFLLATLVSTAVILIAVARGSWGVAAVSLLLAVAAGIAAVPRDFEANYVDHQYRTHRAALAGLAADYRAGRLHDIVALPADVRSLSPSGYAYAGDKVLFVQLWQNWRAESGTGLAYLTEPPTPDTQITTASGDFGHAQREVGDGWWWVA
ncbi:hypothetical protein [Paractinoplanes lichenicola]|uniref:Uncharacterized protein n=1 Tax=Paractinoplanes lichenicola TaxID=2802976 RepID=A0ABS1VLY4_9ACTN|nr:hypothetical protein [Actinoplanes lichenicola]MBL7255743.1 hypothetical protein [Actinoplanes lichenicola]